MMMIMIQVIHQHADKNAEMGAMAELFYTITAIQLFIKLQSGGTVTVTNMQDETPHQIIDTQTS